MKTTTLTNIVKYGITSLLLTGVLCGADNYATDNSTPNKPEKEPKFVLDNYAVIKEDNLSAQMKNFYNSTCKYRK